MSSRFDLEGALAAWRRTVERDRTFGTADLDELECHVGDPVTAITWRGLYEEEDVRRALREMGSYGLTKERHRKRLLGQAPAAAPTSI